MNVELDNTKEESYVIEKGRLVMKDCDSLITVIR